MTREFVDHVTSLAASWNWKFHADAGFNRDEICKNKNPKKPKAQNNSEKSGPSHNACCGQEKCYIYKITAFLEDALIKLRLFVLYTLIFKFSKTFFIFISFEKL